MKKTLLIGLLVISMLAMVGFTPVEASYWQTMKEMYEWNGTEGETALEIKLAIPDMEKKYKVQIISKSNLKEFITYSEIHIEDVKEGKNIPTIKMYTNGSNIYLNKEAAIAFVTATGFGETVEIAEDYVMLEGSQNTVKFDSNILNDAIQFIEGMDLGIDLGMKKDGDTFKLTLDSDQLIDLFDAYMRYVLTNMDKMPKSFMPEEIVISEEEKQEMLEQYDAFVTLYKDTAKEFMKGSKFYQESTLANNKYSAKSEVLLKTPMGELEVKTVGTSVKLDSANIELPSSVKKITEEELSSLILGQIMPDVDVDTGLKAIVELDGSYIKFGELDFEEGNITLKIEEGKAYITAEDALELLGVEVEGVSHIRDLEDYGFFVEWNEELKTIEIYQ